MDLFIIKELEIEPLEQVELELPLYEMPNIEPPEAAPLTAEEERGVFIIDLLG